MQLLSVIFRTIFFYFFVSFAYRLMGKREVGQLGIIDLIVSILIAELVAISIENLSDPMFLTIVPISILVVLEIVLAYVSLKNKTIRNLFSSKPSLIISNGMINYHEMIKQRYTIEDLLISLRQKEIKDISEVEYAFLEPNGKLSIFKYKPFSFKKVYPIPLILDGKINEHTLKVIKKDYDYIEKVLKENNLELKNIFYAFYKNKKIYFIKKDGN